ncbi:conserved hypothetical protein [uncultured Mycobacterium sp.]|uniref:Uncharacterized protein n=1 Tax=uncultured Mycobacterium sp. TaxID=171292 RepID=A0A1Y5PFL2_9MYCO|nr:conserved hypothetical protein [uncultured Mycobacterium sp.]
MPDIDFGLAYEFVDPSDGVPRQLRFRQNYAPPGDPRIFDGTGQLVATVADGHRADNGHELAISRPGVQLTDVELAIDGWDDWATFYVADNGIDRHINLAAIRRRIHAAGLD